MNREEIEALRKEIEEKKIILATAERDLNADNFKVVLKAIHGTRWEVVNSFVSGPRLMAYDASRHQKDSNETVSKIQEAWKHPFDVEELSQDGVAICFDGDGGSSPYKGQGYFITFNDNDVLIKFIKDNDLKLDTWQIKRDIRDMEYRLNQDIDFYKLIKPFEAI